MSKLLLVSLHICLIIGLMEVPAMADETCEKSKMFPYVCEAESYSGDFKSISAEQVIKAPVGLITIGCHSEGTDSAQLRKIVEKLLRDTKEFFPAWMGAALYHPKFIASFMLGKTTLKFAYVNDRIWCISDGKKAWFSRVAT